MTREALLALVRRRSRLWGILPGFGEVVARRTQGGFTLRIDDFAPGSSWTLLEAGIEDRGAACLVRGRVGRDPRLWRWRLRNGIGAVLLLALLVVPFANTVLDRRYGLGALLVVLGVGFCVNILNRHVAPFGVARREPADRAFLVAWLEHKIGVPVTVRAGGAEP